MPLLMTTRTCNRRSTILRKLSTRKPWISRWKKTLISLAVPSTCKTKTTVSKLSRFKTIWSETIGCAHRVLRLCQQPLNNRHTYRCNSSRCRSTWWINNSNSSNSSLANRQLWANGWIHNKCNRWTTPSNNSWSPQAKCSILRLLLSLNRCSSWCLENPLKEGQGQPVARLS